MLRSSKPSTHTGRYKLGELGGYKSVECRKGGQIDQQKSLKHHMMILVARMRSDAQRNISGSR